MSFLSIYEAADYRRYLDSLMRPESGRAWGAVKRLAAVLKCHSTYVSQIINGKADLSTEQAVAVCRFFQLDRDSTDHFMDLLNRDKAGNQDTREYFSGRIEKRLADRLNLKRRLNVSENLTLEQESKYYRGWLPQAVHMSCQLPGIHSSKSIAMLLQVSEENVIQAAKDLESIGLIENTNTGYKSLKESVHLGEDSPMINRLHANWRLKALNDITTGVKLPGVHYSSAVTISTETAKSLRELILRHVEETRALIIPSPPDHIYMYCLDFYPLTKIP